MRSSTKAERRTLLLATPFVAGIVLTVILPALGTVVLAFFDWDLVQPPNWIGVDGFREMLGDDIFRISLRNSIAFVAISVPLRLLGVVGLFVLLHRAERGTGVYRSAVMLPTFIPDVAYAIAWLWIANPLYGPMNVFLGEIGGPTPSWLTDPVAAQSLVVMMSIFTIGEGFVIAVAVRNQIPPEYFEVAAVSGVGPLSTFRRITLPIMSPALLMIAMRDAAFAFQATFVPALIVTDGGPPPFSTTYLPLFAYRNSFEYLRYGYAAAVSVVMLAVTALILLALRGVIRRNWSTSV